MRNSFLAPWISALLAIFAVLRPARAQTEDWPRSVLITNDDGIDYPGLQGLACAFAAPAELTGPVEGVRAEVETPVRVFP